MVEGEWSSFKKISSKLNDHSLSEDSYNYNYQKDRILVNPLEHIQLVGDHSRIKLIEDLEKHKRVEDHRINGLFVGMNDI